MCTHVSQAPDQRVGVAAETRSWLRQGRVRCTGIQRRKKKPLQHAQSRTLSSWDIGPEGQSDGKVLTLKNRRLDVDQIIERDLRDLDEGRIAIRR
jgi:hypothetical protein